MTQWLRITASRLRAVFTNQRLDRDVEDELRDHLESLCEAYEAAGMSRGEARGQAVLKLGRPEQLREANRDHRGIPLLETLVRDFAFRTLSKSSSFTAGRRYYSGVGDWSMQLPVQLYELHGVAAAAWYSRA